MNKEEFLRELEEALAGDVPETVIRDNVRYYGSYLTQEMAKGRTVDEVVNEIGEPFILAKTVIDSYEASGGQTDEGGASYREADPSGRDYGEPSHTFRAYDIDLNKWYWKLAAFLIVFLVLSFIIRIVGGIVGLLFRFAGPLLMIFLVIWIVKRMK